MRDLGQSAKGDILVQSLYMYLHDNVNLEIKEIVSACSKLLHGDLPVTFTEETRLNTYSGMIDEYYHVYIAQDMILQLRQRYPHLSDIDYALPDSRRAVGEIRAKLDSLYHDVFEILANCCFETTLVRELVELFNSPGVHSIKYYVNDHMNDESRHYAFFFDLMTYLWREVPDD